MPSVTFLPQNKTVRVSADTSLLEAAYQAHITINNLCGGDGICGRCKMIVTRGEVSGAVSAKLTREEIRQGYVLACQTAVTDDLAVDIPAGTLAKEKARADEDAERFRDLQPEFQYDAHFVPAPLVDKVYLVMEPPTLANNLADHQRVGLRRDIAEVMNVEPGDTSADNYIAVVDMGTTTLVAHLVEAHTMKTVDAKACFNSQGIYGREVTRRMITAEQKGVGELQRLLVEDINGLITSLADSNRVKLKDITAVVCAGNTAMGHFLLALNPRNIRRFPYVPASVSPPPLRAAEVGLKINPRGLLYSLPGISGWVGSDITAGILYTRMNEKEELGLLLDIGTNGEVVIGHKEWLVATSASAGPALEGASVDCGMRAERGAVERVFAENGAIRYRTIDDAPPKGICGSGIIDFVGVLLREGYINRSGRFLPDRSPRIVEVDGVRRYILAAEGEAAGKPVFITESDIQNIITAKAAIFAAMKILVRRLEIHFRDIERFYIGGAFGRYIDVENAIAIGLIPEIPRDRIQFVGNTSIQGAKIVAFYKEALRKIERIRENTTYYDLMGAEDYIEEFRKAMFLPHTDIEEFHG
jgi:uncharacterized 2Fe-2S/4Fe-4S cluster protein (DUF4445 family)